MDRFADDVPEDVKRRRNSELLAVQQRVTAEENQRLIGQTVEVMVEGESKLVSRQAAATSRVELGWERSGRFGDPVFAHTQLVARTRGDQVVCFDADSSLKGQIVQVQITDAKGMTLFAKLLEPVAA
jgi:tRNA-2-methylthio-N6-dimethylallyladenosine synthase